MNNLFKNFFGSSKKEIKNLVVENKEMKLPTYLEKENAKFLELEKGLSKDKFSKIRIFNTLENKEINELYEIYFYGLVVSDHLICGIFDEKTSKTKPCLIVAKCIQTGNEILLYDQAKYGYNSVFCDEFHSEDTKNRPLVKLEIPHSKIEIDFGYNIDFEEEKEDFDFDEENSIETINSEKISFEEVKKNCFDYIKITAIDEAGNKRVICELELA